MTVLVTGATGHIGFNLVRLLKAENRNVRVFVRSDVPWLSKLDAEIVRGDVRSPESIERALEGVETVYHLAGIVSIVRGMREELLAVNEAGVRNIMNACLKASVRKVVHFSSIHAFSSSPKDALVDEKRPPISEKDQGWSDYDLSKAAGERAVQAAIQKGLNAVIVNPTGVIGPHDHRPSSLGKALLDMHTRRLPSLVDGGFDFVDARDVAKGALLAEHKGRTGERYILSGEWLSTKDLAKIVEEKTGSRPPRMTCPLWLARAAAPFAEAYGKITKKTPVFTVASIDTLENYRRISNEKAQKELGYSPRPLRETIFDTLDWFKQAGVITW